MTDGTRSAEGVPLSSGSSDGSSRHISLGVRRGLPPRFHELEARPFEELCRDLFDAQTEISTCEIYGKPGQTQFGIDLLAVRSTGTSYDVGQCKCYENFTARLIAAASDDFLQHLDGHWAGWSIKRFVLLVASDLSGRQQQDEIAKQRKRFAEREINYEAWSAPILRNRLAPHPSVVRTHLGEPWVREICGDPIGSTTREATSFGSRSVVVGALANQLEAVASRFAGEVEQALEPMREAWRAGRSQQASRWIENLRSDRVSWGALHRDLQVRLLRFQARIVLDSSDDPAPVLSIRDEADRIAPGQPDRRLNALIAYKEAGPAYALDVLGEPRGNRDRNLASAFLLEADRAPEAESMLPSSDSGPDAETFRLRALLRLRVREMDLARLEIQKALDLQPSWFALRFLNAVINYYSAIANTPAVAISLDWPEPNHWDLALRDSVSLERLRLAEAEFARLLAAAEPASPAELDQLHAWRLACLSNDPDRQESAAGYSRELLDSNPMAYRALSWAISRGFEVDLERSIHELRAIADSGAANLPELVALCACYLANGQPEAAITLLGESEPAFEDSAAGNLWRFWQAQATAVAGMPDAALAVLEGQDPNDDLLATAKSIALRARAEVTGEWSEYIGHLEDRYSTSKDPSLLLSICTTLASQKLWAGVAEHATELVEQIPTPSALGLSATAAYNVGEFETSLRLLTDHVSVFEGGQLPAELRRLRVLCQTRLGLLPQAVAEARVLASEQPDADRLAMLFDVQVAKGDLAGAALTARDLAEREEVTREQALRIARIVGSVDAHLAQSLWRQAARPEAPDELVAPLLQAAYQLSLDQETGPLVRRMVELGREGRHGVQEASLDDVRKMIAAERERSAQLQEHYVNCRAPIHIIAEVINTPLSHIYYRSFRPPERDITYEARPALLTRHGGRTDGPDFDPNAICLTLDITAMLVADSLGVLNMFEARFGPLQIPAQLVPCLLSMQNRHGDQQPARVSAQRDVLRQLSDGNLTQLNSERGAGEPTAESRAALGEAGARAEALARERGSFVLGFARVMDTAKQARPEGELAQDRGINLRGLLEALRVHGVVAQPAFEAALVALGVEASGDIPGEFPQRGAEIICAPGTAETLSTTGLLSDACRLFSLQLLEQEVHTIRIEVRESEVREAEVASLGNLIDRIRRGIDQGGYRVLPDFPTPDDPGAEARKWSPESMCLLSLLRFDPAIGDLILCDDRYVNSYATRDHIPILSTLDFLHTLCSKGLISDSDYLSKLGQVRESKLWFFPVTADEIISRLDAAPISEGGVNEPRELADLRRYVNTSLLAREVIQRPPLPVGSANARGELQYIEATDRATVSALVRSWISGDREQAAAKADWIYENLYLDLNHINSWYGASEESGAVPDARFLAAASVARLAIQSIALTDPNRYSGDSTSDFLGWLDDRVIRRKAESDPLLVPSIVDALKTAFRQAVGAAEEQPAIILRLRDVYERLPAELKGRLDADPEFIALLLLRSARVVTVDDLTFEPDAFFTAATEAMNGREGEVKASEARATITFTLLEECEDAQLGFEFIHPKKGDMVRVATEDAFLFLDSAAARESGLRQQKQWFDLPANREDRAIAHLASLPSTKERVQAAESLRERSASLYYQRLRRRITDQAQFSFSDLVPPDAGTVLGHFGLEVDLPDAERLRQCVEVAGLHLVEDRGIEGATEHLSCLPVPLPNSILQSLQAMNEGDARELVDRLVAYPATPLSQLHFMRLLLGGFGGRRCEKLALRVCSALLSEDGQIAAKAFLALANWISHRLAHWDQFRRLPTPMQITLCWAHSERVFRSFVAAGAPSDWIQKTFEGAERRLHSDIFRPREGFWRDLAHPRRVDSLIFALSGIAYGLGEDLARLMRSRISQEVSEMATVSSEGLTVPALPLFLMRDLGENSAGSFLGADFRDSIAPGLSDAGQNAIATYKPVEVAQHAIEAVKESVVSPAWLQIYATFSDLPPSNEFPLRELFEEVDLESVIRSDVRLGQAAMQTVCSQLIHIEDEQVWKSVRDRVVAISALVHELDRTGIDDEDRSNLLSGLVESAFLLATAAPEERSPAEEFAWILGQMIFEASDLAEVVRPIVFRLWNELPAVEAIRLQQFLTRLRAL